MGKIQIFIGYLGLIPQYHELNTPEESVVHKIKEVSRVNDVRLIGRPTKYFGQILFKKFNKRFTQKIHKSERI